MQSCEQISQPFVTYLIYTSQHNDVTHMQTSCTDLTVFAQPRRNVSAGWRYTSKATIAGWTQILNTTFRGRTGRLIHRIYLSLRTFGALWQQPFMPTSNLSHCKHWSTVSKKHGNQFLCQHFEILSVWCLTDWKQSLKTTEMPFHTNSEHGQWHRLMLTFIGPLLCNFNGGVIEMSTVNAV